jgi:hypothetical protein
MFLCRSMCCLLSGRPSFGIRLLLHSVVLSVAVLPFSGSFSVAHAVRCSPSRIRLRCCSLLCVVPVPLHAPRAAHTHLTHRTRRSLTTQYPHTSYTTHHAHHTNTSHHPSLTLAHTQVWDGMLLVVYLGCTPVLDQVRQIYPMLCNPSQVKTSYTKSYPHKYTYKDTHKDTHTIRGMQVEVHPHSAIYTYKYTFQLTPQIRPQRMPTNTLTAELLRPCYHVTWPCYMVTW